MLGGQIFRLELFEGLKQKKRPIAYVSYYAMAQQA
jgi:hypothetical protein